MKGCLPPPVLDFLQQTLGEAAMRRRELTAGSDNIRT